LGNPQSIPQTRSAGPVAFLRTPSAWGYCASQSWGAWRLILATAPIECRAA